MDAPKPSTQIHPVSSSRDPASYCVGRLQSFLARDGSSAGQSAVPSVQYAGASTLTPFRAWLANSNGMKTYPKTRALAEPDNVGALFPHETVPRLAVLSYDVSSNSARVNVARAALRRRGAYRAE